VEGVETIANIIACGGRRDAQNSLTDGASEERRWPFLPAGIHNM
jgi:hypothetical protein